MVNQRQTNPKPWGTLEDLLLASAVNRHGTSSWDSVAMELHNRTSQSPSFLTPQDCRNKFYDLKRRFLSQNLHDSDSSSLLPMLDQLRKIRVEELRRDVQRRDVLIVSLEMKVKRLEEERNPSFHEPHGGPDPDADAAKTNLRPQNPAASEDDSDNRKNIRSPNESNSTSKKYDVRQNGVVQENPIPESVKISKITGTGPPRTGDKPGREWSFNGAAAEPEPGREKNWVAGGGYKERNWRSSRRSQTAVGDSNEAWESVSESKQEGRDGAVSKQQSSDVQSSGSLSQRKRCRNSSGEEPEVSPAKPKPSAVKSEALLKFLEIIRSHRLGSAFERRVRSQESDRYKNLIRQHIDLRTIRARVVKGAYADSFHPFFRDLLLLFNNAIIFFHTTSPENDAAVKLRALVLEEMNDKARKPQPQPQPQPTKPCTTAMVGCRKSDSVAAVWDVGGKKAEKSSREIKGKSEVGDCVEIKIYEKGRWKKGLNGRKKNGEVKHEYGGNELSSHDGMEVGMEKKERVRKKKMKKKKKKQGAVRFLKRMRQNCCESLKEEEEEEDEDEDEERKKEGIKREKVRGKRGVGRPAKKGERVKVKREEGREEVSGGKPRKRSRR